MIVIWLEMLMIKDAFVIPEDNSIDFAGIGIRFQCFVEAFRLEVPRKSA